MRQGHTFYEKQRCPLTKILPQFVPAATIMPADSGRVERMDLPAMWNLAGLCLRAALGLWLVGLLAGLLAMSARCAINAWQRRAGHAPLSCDVKSG